MNLRTQNIDLQDFSFSEIAFNNYSDYIYYD